MRELVLFIAKSLVDSPDQVKVTEIQGDEGRILKIEVASEDIGKVIGKQGRIAKALRTVVRAANREDDKVFVEIVS
ncbi:MAG: KH domain-containing protein [Bacillota bacterium]|nr:KH domain-containing protein [Bacillota bacterium]